MSKRQHVTATESTLNRGVVKWTCGHLKKKIFFNTPRVVMQGQPPPAEGVEAAAAAAAVPADGEQASGDKKQKENTAYAKKMVLRLAGLMGLGGAVSIIYIFGERAPPPAL